MFNVLQSLLGEVQAFLGHIHMGMWKYAEQKLVLLVLFWLFAVSGCDVSSYSCEQGWGRGTCMLLSLRVDAWPMLFADAGQKRLKSHHVNHNKYDLLEESP